MASDGTKKKKLKQFRDQINKKNAEPKSKKRKSDDISDSELQEEIDNFLKVSFPEFLKSNPTKKEKFEKAQKTINAYTIPDRYLVGFSGNLLFLRQLELVKKKFLNRESRYTPLKTDKIAQKQFKTGERQIKKSSCTQKWKAEYPNANSLEEKSEITGIPFEDLDEVYRKGLGAFYSSGSRPGMSPQQWAIARANCFVLNKETVTQGPDHYIYERAIRKSPKAKKWFQEHPGWR